MASGLQIPIFTSDNPASNLGAPLGAGELNQPVESVANGYIGKQEKQMITPLVALIYDAFKTDERRSTSETESMSCKYITDLQYFIRS